MSHRGLLDGPLCAIYGFAGVMLTMVLPELRGNWLFLFLGSAIWSTVFEWIAGHILERSWYGRWWDYSSLPLNLDGYICLPYSLLWGLLGSAAVQWGSPLLLGSVLCPAGSGGENSPLGVPGADGHRRHRLPHRPIWIPGDHAAPGAGGQPDHRGDQAPPGRDFPAGPPPSGEKLRGGSGGKEGESPSGGICPGRLLLQNILAVFHRRLPGGCDGDHLLLCDRRGADEPQQRGLGGRSAWCGESPWGRPPPCSTSTGTGRTVFSFWRGHFWAEPTSIFAAW